VQAYDPLYLEGIACFNRRDYFQSHEVWEELWLEARGTVREFYKGLIQGAVALHHLRRGNRHGAEKLLRGCQRLLGRFEPCYQGLDVEGFLSSMAQCVARYAQSDAAARNQAAGYPRIELQPPA
jgi:uncharacterized protein